jgi:ABC-type transporter Mla subunit MlaD
MAPRSQAVRLGLFLLAAAALAAIGLTVFGGIKLRRAADHYYIPVDDTVNGLDSGAAVSVMGVRVGEVSDIRLARGATRVIIEISVRPRTPIARDAVAYLRQQGFTQLREVDIEQHDPSQPLLHPGANITYRPTAFDELVDEAGRIAQRTGALLDKVNELADQVLATARRFDQAPDAMAAIRRAADQLGQAAREVRSLVGQNRAGVANALSSFGQTADEANTTLRRMDDTLTRIDRTADELARVARGSGSEARAALRAIRLAARDIQDLSRELRRAPSRLLFSRPAPERKLP